MPNRFRATFQWRWVTLSAVLSTIFTVVLSLAFLAIGNWVSSEPPSERALLMVAGILSLLAAGMIVTHVSGRIAEPVIGTAVASGIAAVIGLLQLSWAMVRWSESVEIGPLVWFLLVSMAATAISCGITALGGLLGRQTGRAEPVLL